MTNREKFMMFVYLGAVARDLSRETADSESVAGYAARIPERQIPPNPCNAARVYLAVLDNQAQPHAWMIQKSIEP
jgi:hypothetical protein